MPNLRSISNTNMDYNIGYIVPCVELTQPIDSNIDKATTTTPTKNIVKS